MKREHPGSREMFDIIAQWDESEVVVSKNFGWSRMGILGILGDHVIRHTKGDIAGVIDIELQLAGTSEIDVAQHRFLVPQGDEAHISRAAPRRR